MTYLKHIAGIVLLFIVILAAPAIIAKMKQPPAPPQPVVEAEKNPVATPAPVAEEPPKQRLTGTTGINRKPPIKAPARPAVQPPPKATSRGGDSIIIGGGSSVRDNVVSGMLRGGSGGDSLTIDGPGWASVDGAHVASIEIFKLKNGQQNLIYFYAAGLATLDGGLAVVEGDAGADTVWLDRAILWTGPVAEGGFQRFDGSDGQGGSFSVSVTKGVTVDYRDR